MMPKKRRSTSLDGVSSAAPSSSAVADPDDPLNQKDERMDPAYRNACKQAFLAHRRRNSTEAFKLFDEILFRYPDNGSAHTLLSKIHMKLFFDAKDPTLQQKHLKNALDASRRAVALSPGSVICAMFHAKLLFNIAKDAEGLEEAVRECHRWLNIEFPEVDFKDSDYRAVNSLRHLQELMEKIQKSPINPGKNFSDDFLNDCDMDLEDYFREIEEDKMSEVLKVVDQLTYSNRLDQNLSPSTNLEQMDFHRSSRLYKLEKKRKCKIAEKFLSSRNDINFKQTTSYWNTISVEEKQEFLKTRIEDIRTHLSSLKDKSPLTVFSAAVQYAMHNKSWKYWECFDCFEKYEDWDLLKQHFWEKHFHGVPSIILQDIPADRDRAWIDKLINFPWKPIDTQKALKIMELESKDSSLLSEECSVDRTVVDIEESDNYEFSVIAEIPVRGEDKSSVIDCDDREWPFSDDVHRAEILDRAKITFLMLLNKNYLSYKLFRWILRTAVQELESVIPRALILKFSLHKSPLSICFLETSKLVPVLDFLSKIADRLSCEQINSTDDPKIPVRQRVVFSRDFSSLVLSKGLLAVEMKIMAANDSVEDDGCAVISESDDHEHEAVLESVNFSNYLLSASTIVGNTTLWTGLLEKKKQLAQGIYKKYLIGVGILRDLLKEIRRQSHRRLAICKTKASFKEGIKKSELAVHDFESILVKRRQELSEEEPSEKKMISYDTESSVIGEILIGGSRESEEINQSSIHTRNRSIKETLSKIGSGLLVECCITEAKRRRITFEIGKLELQLKLASGYDYRDFIVPTLISFVKMRLEDAVLKIASEKSEAAREALLAELEHHEKSSVHKREEKKGKKPKKSKEKKRKKNISGAKASKELSEVEEKQNPVTQNAHSAMDIQDPPMDTRGDAVLESAVDEWQEDDCHLDIQFEQIPMSDSSENGDGVSADNLVAGTASGATTEMNFDAKKSVPKREERKGKSPKKSKKKKRKKNISGATAKELSEVEEKQNPVTQNAHSAMDIQGPPMDTRWDAVLGSAVDEWQEDVSHLDIQCEQSHMSDSSENADGVIADNLVADTSSWATTEMNFDAKKSVPKTEELKGKRPKKSKNKKKKKKKQHFCGAKASKEFPYMEERHNPAKQKQVFLRDPPLHERSPMDMSEADKNEEAVLGTDIDERQEDVTQLDNQFKQLEMSDSDVEADGVITDNLAGAQSGLEMSRDQPEATRINCFLNVIIQSLWFLSTFQDEFSRISSVHQHTGYPCIICCLFDIFTDLRKAAKKKSKKVVDPSTLRHALSYCFPELNFFQKNLQGRMNDAPEVLVSILHGLHWSLTTYLWVSGSGSGDNKTCGCLAHRLFVTRIIEGVRCGSCDLLSGFSYYSYYFQLLSAKNLRDMKRFHWSRSFSELLKLMNMYQKIVRCEPGVVGCGALNFPGVSITNLSRYFIIVLGWQSIEESQENVLLTLASLGAELDMSLAFEGLKKETKYCLVSLVCCLRWPYVCFGYNKSIKGWFRYEDNMVTFIGTWNDVVIMCQIRYLQPQLLFFEAVS